MRRTTALVTFVGTLLGLGLGGLVLPPKAARAEPTAADLESARGLFKKGKELRAAGDLAAALEKFKAAHALAGTPITGVELGRTHMLRREWVEARDAFLAVGRIPTKANESANAKAARAEAAGLAAELEPKIPSLLVSIKGVPVADVTLTIDGVAIPTAAIDEPRRLNPGKHVVVASVTGSDAEERVEIELAEKERKTIVLELAPKPVAPPPTSAPATATATAAPAPAAPAPSVDHGTSSLRPTLGWIGVGVAGVGIVVGTVTGLDALSRANTAKKRCVDDACPPDVHGEVDSGRTMGNVSTAAFAIAGVGVVAAVVAFVLVPDDAPKKTGATVRPAIGLGTFGLVGSF